MSKAKKTDAVQGADVIVSPESIGEWVQISSLVPWDRNPRYNDGAVESVAKSIQRFGFASPIIARTADRRIIAGHTRWKAAMSLGLELVPVRFLDLSDEEATALTLADNKLGELADWDDAKLAEVLASLGDDGVSGLGWTGKELAALAASLAPSTAPEEFPSFGEDIVTEHRCPKCSYKWSGASS